MRVLACLYLACGFHAVTSFLASPLKKAKGKSLLQDRYRGRGFKGDAAKLKMGLFDFVFYMTKQRRSEYKPKYIKARVD